MHGNLEKAKTRTFIYTGWRSSLSAAEEIGAIYHSGKRTLSKGIHHSSLAILQ